jgi:hypothetical protein
MGGQRQGLKKPPTRSPLRADRGGHVSLARPLGQPVPVHNFLHFTQSEQQCLLRHFIIPLKDQKLSSDEQWRIMIVHFITSSWKFESE